MRKSYNFIVPFSQLFKWRYIDTLGISSAFLCIVHCISLPILAFVLPTVGTASVLHVHAEWRWLFIAYSFLLGCYSIVHGYFHHHNNLLVVFSFLLGFVMLLADTYIMYFYHLLAIFGGLGLLFAHTLNWQLSRRNNLSCPCARKSS